MVSRLAGIYRGAALTLGKPDIGSGEWMPPASYGTPRQSIDALNHTRLFIKTHEVVFALLLTVQNPQ